MTFIDDFHGAVAALPLLVALLYVDEAGVPLPFAPNEVLLLVAGLLISTGALNPLVFVPAAYVFMVGGMLTGYWWARAIGSERLRAVAVRLHAERAFDRTADRLRHASTLQLGIARLIPGIRPYATLIAGAAEVDLRRFCTAALPALLVWEGVVVALGALVGLPAEHFLSQFQRLAVTGVVLVLAAAASFTAIRRIPHSMRSEPFSRTPTWSRVVLALSLDFGVVATVVAGLDRITRSIVRSTRFAGLSGLAILVALTVIGYVTVTRRGPGRTAGEGIFDVSYIAPAKT